ncbi:MAG: hypothetical protein K2G08_09990 [Paramuribaculum sp.]|nr:hypothetical protein [Paramuribaculum sp.]
MLKTEAGATLSFSGTSPNSQWMHNYVFIDFGNDGQFDVDLMSTELNGDLVAFTGYALSTHSTKHSGTEHTDTADPTKQSNGASTDNGDYWNMPTVTLPADIKPGTYRVRLKNDWNSVHPYGRTINTIVGQQCDDNNIDGTGGYIIDFTIEVVGPSYAVTFAEVANGSFVATLNGAAVTSGDQIEEGSVLTLEATPEVGYEFVHYTVNGVAIEGNTVTVDGEMTIGAEFALKNFAVTIAEIAGGSLEVLYNEAALQSGATVPYGAELTLRATADAGYTFGGYLVNGTATQEETLTVTDAVELGATFTLNTYSFSFAELEGGSIVVKAGETELSTEAPVAHGTVVTLEATPAEGYVFKNFTVNGEAIEGNTYTVESSVAFGAVFELQKFVVTFAQVEGGAFVVKNGETAIESGAEVAYGTELTLEATAETAYDFVTFTANGEAFEGSQFTVKGEVALGAEFAKKSFTLTFAEVENGTITVKAGEETLEAGADVVYGTELTLEATPAEGYEFVSFTANGEEIEGNTYVYEGPVVLGAVFAKIPSFAVTIQPAQNGSLAVMLNGEAIESGVEVARDQELTLVATPAKGYTLKTFVVNDTETLETTITVSEALTIGAIFQERPEAEYTAPSGEGVDTNGYLETVTVSGAAKDVVINRNQKNGDVYEVCDAEEEIFEVYPGSEFSMNFLAKYTNNITTSAPTPQDLRYCVAFVYADWNADGQFDLLGRYGHGYLESGFAGNVKGNYDEVMNITHNFAVPADAELGRTRIRVVYTEAWDANVKTGGNIPSANYSAIDKGYSYDFCLKVVEAPSYAVNFSAEGNGTLKAYTDAALTAEVENGASLKATEFASGLYLAVAPESDDYELQSLLVNEADVTSEVAEGVYHLAKVNGDVVAKATFVAIPSLVVNFTAEGEGTLKVFTDADLTAEVENGAKLKVAELTDGLYFTVAAADDNEFKTLVINENDVTAEVVNGVYHLAVADADVTATATFAAIPVNTYNLYMNLIDATDGTSVEIYTDAELTQKLYTIEHPQTELDEFFTSKEFDGTLYFKVNMPAGLSLKAVNGLNEIPFDVEIVNNIFAIEVSEEILMDFGNNEYLLPIDFIFDQELSGLTEIGVDLNAGDVEIYNLQGVKVAAENLTNGYYIIRQGGKTFKVRINK